MRKVGNNIRAPVTKSSSTFSFFFIGVSGRYYLSSGEVRGILDRIKIKTGSRRAEKSVYGVRRRKELMGRSPTLPASFKSSRAPNEFNVLAGQNGRSHRLGSLFSSSMEQSKAANLLKICMGSSPDVYRQSYNTDANNHQY